ncbi:MAG: outer membrane beta-barrel protein [Bryobacteraceae bacterium]
MNRFAWLALTCASVSSAQSTWFVGGGAGVSTLSGDARAEITAASTAISQYKPENGPIVHAFAGCHMRDWLSVQGAWSWNRNAVALVSSVVEGGRETAYEQARRSSQNNAAGDALIYFRRRESSVRPFLGVGLGVMSFRSTNPVLRISKGSPTLPGSEFSAVKPGLRAAAGIDLMIRGGWGIRYAFLETMQGNPISQKLTPKGSRGLANFQNLFGVMKYFR